MTSKNESEKEKETTPQSLFDDPMGDLFKKVKPRSAKKAKASSFLEDEEEDEEDIFGLGKSSTPTTAGGKDSKAGSNSTPKQDIFQVLVMMINCVSQLNSQSVYDFSFLNEFFSPKFTNFSL